MNRFGIFCASALGALTFARPALATDYYVRVSVDQVKAGYQRGKSADRDYLTVYASSTHDPASRTNSAPTDIGEFVTNRTVDLTPNVQTDEILVSDADTIQIYANIQNSSHTDPTVAISTALKIAGGVVALMGGGELLQAALTQTSWARDLNLEGGIVTLTGAVLALGGEVIGDLSTALGLSDPDCDGAVFAPQNPVLVDVGKFFARFPGPIPLNTPLGIMSWTDDTQQSPSECGHAPSATIRVNLVLTRPPAVPPSFKGIGGPATHFKPIAGGLRTNGLLGMWADQPTIESSRVTVNVTQAKMANFSSAARVEHATSVAARREDRGVLAPGLAGRAAERTGGRGAISPALTDPPLTLEVGEQVQSAAGKRSFRTTGQSGGAVPMQASLFAGNRFPSEVAPYVGASPAGSLSAASYSAPFVAIRKPARTRKTERGVVVRQITAKAMSFADSVQIPGGVSVQLYGAYDDQERYVGNRLRYMRTNERGEIVTDAMLQGAQHTPR